MAAIKLHNIVITVYSQPNGSHFYFSVASRIPIFFKKYAAITVHFPLFAVIKNIF